MSARSRRPDANAARLNRAAALMAGGASVAQTAAALGLTLGGVYHMRNTHKALFAPLKCGAKKHEDRIDRVRSLLAGGASVAQAAAALGVQPPVIYHLRAANRGLFPALPRGRKAKAGASPPPPLPSEAVSPTRGGDSARAVSKASFPSAAEGGILMDSKGVSITIKISPAQAQALEKFAAKEGYFPSLYARLLFEAAFGARVAQTRHIPSGDRELEAALKSVFALAGQADAEEIGRALNIEAALAAKMLSGWKLGLREKAAA